MSHLTIYDDRARVLSELDDPDEIRDALAGIGVRFERWAADRVLPEGAGQDEVLAAYAEPVARLKREHGFVTADVVRMHPQHPDRAALRAKFLDEHTHADPEVRFFVEGRGLFVLHPDHRVLSLVAEAGDLVFVPAGARHWFDMGERPRFCAIRVFTDPAGWVGIPTGDDVAGRYPTLTEADRGAAPELSASEASFGASRTPEGKASDGGSEGGKPKGGRPAEEADRGAAPELSASEASFGASRTPEGKASDGGSEGGKPKGGRPAERHET